MSLPKFDHNGSDWWIFLNQLEQFFIANDIDDTQGGKKKAYLLLCLSEETVSLLRSLFHPDDINSKTYEEVRNALNKHFKPIHCNFVERCKFYNAYKNQKETIIQWAERLRTLAAHCNFESNLNIALRDKFVMGLSTGPIKDKLFMEDIKTLTFDKAIEIASNLESAVPYISKNENFENNKFQNRYNNRQGATKKFQEYQQDNNSHRSNDIQQNCQSGNRNQGSYQQQDLNQRQQQNQNHWQGVHQQPRAHQQRDSHQWQGGRQQQGNQQKQQGYHQQQGGQQQERGRHFQGFNQQQRPYQQQNNNQSQNNQQQQGSQQHRPMPLLNKPVDNWELIGERPQNRHSQVNEGNRNDCIIS